MAQASPLAGMFNLDIIQDEDLRTPEGIKRYAKKAENNVVTPPALDDRSMRVTNPGGEPLSDAPTDRTPAIGDAWEKVEPGTTTRSKLLWRTGGAPLSPLGVMFGQ